MLFKILHLSDLHFSAANVDQDLVTNSLKKKIQELVQNGKTPDAIFITGDIAYSGQSNEYTKAKIFIKDLITICSLNISSVYLIPGNHDVDRSKIKTIYKSYWYTFQDENELNDILSDDSILSILSQNTSNYYDFLKNYMTGKVELGKFGEYVAEITVSTDLPKIKIVGLNSSIFCGYDGDDNKRIALSLQQTQQCFDKVDNTKDIILTCLHHPFETFHPCERATIAVIKRESDILFTGHIHETQGTFSFDSNGEIVHISAGAAYEKRSSENSFNFITLDLKNLTGEVEYYKYLSSQHKWIQNKDNFEGTNGIFKFNIRKKGDQTQTTVTPTKSISYSYKITLDGDLIDLTREKFLLIEETLRLLLADISVSIQKVEEGSINLFITSHKEIPSDKIATIKSLSNFQVISITSETIDQDAVHSNIASLLRAQLKPEFNEYLSNPGASFTHPRAQKDLDFKDIFTPPNLKILELKDESVIRIDKKINLTDLASHFKEENNFLVFYGQDSSGKSTILKWLFTQFYEKGCLPIFLTGDALKEVSLEKIQKHVEKEFHKQYTSSSLIDIKNYPKDKVYLLIDDFHNIRLTKSKLKSTLISNLLKIFSNVIITANDLSQFETYTSKGGSIRNILERFDRYQILEFGPTLRFELIKKWNSLGADFSDQNEIIRLNTDAETHIDSIIGKSFVPSFPIYLLTILQAREIANPQKPEYSIHGFYYELLINDALSKAVKNKADISLFYNYITEYCYFLFKEKIGMNPLLTEDFRKFHNYYCDEYSVEISPKQVLDILISSKLVKTNTETISISYKYVYYFFVAKYLANNVSISEIRDTIRRLCERVYRDEFASIVMFLTHLTKDQFVISELLNISRQLFTEIQPSKLEDDISFINELTNSLPDQFYEALNVNDIKLQELQEEEDLYTQEQELNIERYNYDYDITEDINSLDIVSKIVKAIKTMEITGQVTKKYWGELKSAQKFDLAEETYLLGLRSLGYFYSQLNSDTDVIADYLTYILKKKKIIASISKEEVNRISKQFLFDISTLAAYGIVKRVTNSIGYEKLFTTFSKVSLKHSYNSTKLIDLAIKLEHHKNFPWDEIDSVKEISKQNYLTKIVLNQLVLDYLYMFVTTESEKQKICDSLGIRMEKQRFIDLTSSTKKEK